MTPFGGDYQQCWSMVMGISKVFNKPMTYKESVIDPFCRKIDVNYLIVNAFDPVWWKQDSWVWTRKPAYANPVVRVIPCGRSAGSHPD
jgi:hypothetical protein